MYIDTHVHLTDKRYEDVDQIINNYKTQKIRYVINAGYDTETSLQGQILSQKDASIFFTAGVHPNDTSDFIDANISKILKVLGDEKCLAIGEIGLDYHYVGTDKAEQAKAFVAQIEIATENNLPICMHLRDAHEDMLKLICENKSKLKNGGVMHCFSGSVEMSKIYMDLGMYISFAGPLTFKNARNLDEVAKYVPIDRVLSETDCPYLSPEPVRGTLNEPQNVRFVTKKIAQIKNLSEEYVAESIMQNAQNVFPKFKKWTERNKKEN